MDDRIHIILFDLIKNQKWSEFTRYFIEQKNIDVNIRDTNNNYLIQYALLFNKTNIIQLLIDNGSKLDVIDSDGRSVLFIPIKFNYEAVLDLLITKEHSNIGADILNMYDKLGNTPLHYAIMYNNEHAIKLLLSKSVNVAAQDKRGYSAIHLAIINKNATIINMLLENKMNINLRCQTGESPLHLACNFEMYDTLKLLVNKKAEINITDYDNELTPLLYSIMIGNKNFVELLIEHGANPDLADQYGNTAYHYSIYENRYDIFKYMHEQMVLRGEQPNNKFNYTNIESKTVGHLVFENNNTETERMRYLNMIISTINVNIQDNNGNTCLMYLVKHNLWQAYKKYLMYKKLDIYVHNKNGENCRNLIEKTMKKNEKFEQTEFFNFIVESFYHYIVTNKSDKQFSLSWQNDCGPMEMCKRRIHKYILDSHISTPNFNKYNIEISYGDLINFGTFTGVLLDIVMGLLYLKKKYKFIKTILTENFIENKPLSKYYANIGLDIMSENEFINFEILWINQNLHVPTNFNTTIKNYISDSKKNSKVRFFVMPLGIEIKSDSHANYLIYDNVTNELERFEPHGSRNPNKFNYNPMLLDSVLTNLFSEYFPSIKYVKPEDYLPKIGYQLLDNSENNKYRNIGDPGGFCALWCIWYTDMRLTYPDTPRNKLVETSLNMIRYKGISFRTLIRNYSIKITTLRDEMLSQADIDINMWLNDNYSPAQLTKTIEIIKNKIRETA